MNHWIATLVHNLAVAGFGALMFHAGDNFGFHMGLRRSCVVARCATHGANMQREKEACCS